MLGSSGFTGVGYHIDGLAWIPVIVSCLIYSSQTHYHPKGPFKIYLILRAQRVSYITTSGPKYIPSWFS